MTNKNKKMTSIITITFFAALMLIPIVMDANAITFDVSELKAYYKCNEASGNIINQASSTGSTDALTGEDLTNNGTAIEYQATGNGDITYSCGFTSSDALQGTTASNWQWLSDQSDSTITLWVKSSERANGNNLMVTADSSALNGIIFDWRTTGDLRYITEKGSSPTGNTNWDSNLDENWHFIAHRHDDSANLFKMWVDSGDVSADHSATVPAANTPDYPITIGDSPTIEYGNGFTGNMMEITFWNRVLTDAELTTLYNNGNGLSLIQLTPSEPTNLNATSGNTQVALAWIVPTNEGSTSITDYILEYGDGITWTTFSDGTSTATNGTVTGLNNDQQYSFRVSAVNSEGTSDPSNIAVATPEINVEELQLQIETLENTVATLNATVNQQQEDIDYLYEIWEDVRDTIISWLAGRP